jgi:hypothetical protein
MSNSSRGTNKKERKLCSTLITQSLIHVLRARKKPGDWYDRDAKNHEGKIKQYRKNFLGERKEIWGKLLGLYHRRLCGRILKNVFLA